MSASKAVPLSHVLRGWDSGLAPDREAYSKTYRYLEDGGAVGSLLQGRQATSASLLAKPYRSHLEPLVALGVRDSHILPGIKGSKAVARQSGSMDKHVLAAAF
jgi:hypothetical protein